MNMEIPVDVSKPSLTLKPGDRVRFPRIGNLYSHWATYEGRGKVVHITNVDKSSTPTASTSLITGHTSAIFKRESLRVVAGTGKVYKNNTHDRNSRPLDQDTILKRIRKTVGMRVPYNAFTKNCEHYTTFMRNGDFTSSQVETAVLVIAGVLIVSAAIGLVSYGLSFIRNKKSQHQ